MDHRRFTRREVLRAAGTGAAVGLLPRTGRAARKTLRILQWNHFVPGYDKWFNGQYVKDWGEKNDTDVVVDNVGVRALNSAAAAEVSAKKGHDLFLFLWPKPVYEDEVIDHREIYEECEKKYGKPIDLAIKSTYNPRTKKYFGFSDSYVPDPINWRKSLFDEVGMKPDTWDDLRVGGRKIKEKRGIPVGIGLAPETDTSMAMRAILYSFGGSEQDEEGKLVLGAKKTVEAVKFVKALFQETMSPEVFAWDESSNNRAMLAGRASAVLNAISITREAENKNLLVDGKPIGDDIFLAKAARGPVRRMGLEHVMNVYVIWKFADNVEGAKKFLVDYVGNFHRAFEASEFYNFPCFQKQVPDLKQLLQRDAKGKPADKYAVLADSLEWATNVGYPGYANAAIDDIYSQFIVNNMFAKAAQGVMSPEDAVKEAEAKARDIFAKWKERKLL
ncbi:MAG TPA: ABC transporter substrate-binding protein [Myxococcales bacterium]|nr:ABC transporter substrate-binding protein [Myxococcales bacterium]